jgi:hypothetical protein
MKRSFLFCIICIAATFKIEAQIPNRGFENWINSGSCMVPLGWACINDWMGETENCYSISRSDDHYPASVGNYSIKIENRISILPDAGAAGLIWTGDSTGRGTDAPVFPIIGHPTSLCGYYKFLPQNGDSMDIHFMFYNNGIQVTGGRMISTDTVPEWTPFKIPVSYPDYPDADSARIMISAFYSDNFIIHGNSVLYIDNLRLDTLTSSIDEHLNRENTFSFYPNPASKTVKLKFSRVLNNDVVLEIYNMIGIKMMSAILKPGEAEVDIANLHTGVYFVYTKSPKISGFQKLIIER